MTLRYANESLMRLGHSHASSAHLVLGLVILQGGVAGNLLRKVGLSVQSVEGYLSSRRTSAEQSTSYDGVPLGRSAVSVFERAEAAARAVQHTYLGTEHLLLGIVAEESGEATDLLASVHIDREKIKRILCAELR